MTIRLNLRHAHSARPGHRFYDVFAGGVKVCDLVRGWPRDGRGWLVCALGRLPNHGRFERRGDALRAIIKELERRRR